MGWLQAYAFQSQNLFMSKYLAVGNLSEAHTRDIKIFSPHPDFEFLNVGQGRDRFNLQHRATGRILGDARRRRYDLVFVGKIFYPFFNPRKSLIRNCWKLVREVARHPNILTGRIFPYSRYNGRLAGIDMQDCPIIDNSRFSILRQCVCYFKRELPQNPANAFLYTNAKAEEGENILHSESFRAMVRKLRPISLGLDVTAYKNLAMTEAPKKTDVFFAGNTQHKLNRQIGLKQLERLGTEGYKIDIAKDRLSLQEYMMRCAQAHLVWSPEGGGWDCYRHYEAAWAGSVPLMQSPIIRRYAPLVDEVHALYYYVEDDHLLFRVRQALQNRARLIEMGRAARAHVLAKHTFEALSRYVVEETKRTLQDN